MNEGLEFLAFILIIEVMRGRKKYTREEDSNDNGEEWRNERQYLRWS